VLLRLGWLPRRVSTFVLATEDPSQALKIVGATSELRSPAYYEKGVRFLALFLALLHGPACLLTVLFTPPRLDVSRDNLCSSGLVAPLSQYTVYCRPGHNIKACMPEQPAPPLTSLPRLCCCVAAVLPPPCFVAAVLL
jgi:hypothetical protein